MDTKSHRSGRKRYGLNLNRENCEALIHNGPADVHFSDNTPVQTTNKAKYLGSHINDTGNTITETRGRITTATMILKKLHIFWRRSNCSVKFKMQVVQAILVAHLLHGMESAALPATSLHDLDTFQLKVLRTILHMDTTYVDKANTNAEVYRRANAVIRNETLEGFNNKTTKKRLRFKEILKLSTIYTRRKRFFSQKSRKTPTHQNFA